MGVSLQKSGRKPLSSMDQAKRNTTENRNMSDLTDHRQGMKDGRGCVLVSRMQLSVVSRPSSVQME